MAGIFQIASAVLLFFTPATFLRKRMLHFELESSALFRPRA
ncbi:hypothetical protein LDG_8761 [Legionella drancourtii LLAP12]|uniref:Uncharacterized protein n=1 Tax=Legionella drancourtii LLAP12 TaxID=658187 RepID=G9ETX4_9GAMM|nr:hypothetical protein LDG_8761 [Legionella drancourtii LLAP12]